VKKDDSVEVLTIDGREVRVTHPDKPYFSAQTKLSKLDLVRYGCTLDADGNPAVKWSIRRMLEQRPERFDEEIEAIKKSIQESGEEVQGVWVHDLTGAADVAAQGCSLEAWTKKMVADLRTQPS